MRAKQKRSTSDSRNQKRPKLIFTKNVYETADEYVFHSTMALLEACCSRDQVPLLVIKITIDHLSILIKDGKLKLTAELKKIVNKEDFLKLTQDNTKMENTQKRLF
jgi:hypothetical protein